MRMGLMAGGRHGTAAVSGAGLHVAVRDTALLEVLLVVVLGLPELGSFHDFGGDGTLVAAAGG